MLKNANRVVVQEPALNRQFLRRTMSYSSQIPKLARIVIRPHLSLRDRRNPLLEDVRHTIYPPSTSMVRGSGVSPMRRNIAPVSSGFTDPRPVPHVLPSNGRLRSSAKQQTERTCWLLSNRRRTHPNSSCVEVFRRKLDSVEGSVDASRSTYHFSPITPIDPMPAL